MVDLGELATSTRVAFEAVSRQSASDDPTGNPELTIEVVEQALVRQTPTLLLITPWALEGIMFVEEGPELADLTVGRRRFPVLTGALDPIGPYSTVRLVPDVRGLADQAAARHAAAALAGPFREAVARALRESSVTDPARRDLFKRLGGGSTRA
jgi:hypothetical protein